MAKKTVVKKLDSETLKEITNHVIDRLREEETGSAKARYDRRRANTRMLLRNYRSFTDHAAKAIYKAAHMD
jgi:hypothetical protein